MKKVIIFILIFLIKNILYAQTTPFWVKHMGSPTNDLGNSVVMDNVGNVYTTGSFTGTSDFDPGPGIYNMTSVLGYDIFISKFDASGNFLWARQMGGEGSDFGTSIILDNYGNVYTTGYFQLTSDFDPSSNIFNLTSYGDFDSYVLKLDNMGNFLWSKSWGGTTKDFGFEILTKDDNIYISGYFSLTVDFDPGNGVFNMTTLGTSNDGYILKLNASGDFIWAKQFGGYNGQSINSIALDANGYIYLTGYFYGVMDVDPGNGVLNFTSLGGSDIFLAKLDGLGNLLWAKHMGGIGLLDVGHSFKVDNNENVLLAGNFKNTIDFDPSVGIYNLTASGTDDIFIAKFNTSGDFIWAKRFGGTSNTSLGAISIDQSGNIYSTGSFYSITDFDPSSTDFYLTSNGTTDCFISKIDANGKFIWAKNIGGPNADEGRDIKVDTYGNIHLVGSFQGTVDFDPDTAVYNLSSFGESDIFVIKLKGGPEVNTQPKITLSKSIIPLGQTMIIQGQDFTASGSVTLAFTGAGGIYSINLTANNQGKFSYTYNIPSAAQNGNASVKALDISTNRYTTPIRTFEIQITPLNTPIDYLSIISHHNGATYSVGQQIHFMWTDKLQRQYGNYFYPMSGITANRQYKYRIEYQIGSSGAWQLANILQGSGALNSVINLYQIIQINTSDNNCRIRIIDDYAPTIIKTTPSFAVAPFASNLKAELVWDNSFPQVYGSPVGVAADGVARLYVKVSKKDPGIGAPLQSVNLTLSDGTNNTIEMLGKLKDASNISTYSTEANNANSLTVVSSNSQNGSIWFWYVSPDDFSQDYLGSYASESEREVNLHVTAQLNDGSQDNTDCKIKIVRPPLVLVHGLASDENAWDNFNYGSNNLFITSPIFKYKKAVNISPSESYQYNADLILNPTATSVSGGNNRLNTLQGNISELRWLGFACNQVDYVCHSMGGCVLRTAMSIYSNKFYGTSSNEKYKSYGKGFVHKAITINTPHNNSPVADAVTEYMPQASISINIALQSYYGLYPGTPFYFDFIRPQDPSSFIWKWQASPAVKNLQINNSAGGINLAATNVKNHLITGDVDIYSAQTASFLAELDKYMDLIHKTLKIMRDISPPGPIKTTLSGFLQLEKLVAVFTFIEWYSQQKGVPNFLGDGDLVVPLSSQLAGSNPSSDKVSVFYNTGFLNARHTKITDRTDVGDRVMKLLNSAVGGDFFANIIPATSTGRNANNNLLSAPQNSITQIYSYDTSKIKIISPAHNSSLFADSTLNIQYIVKDTAGLAYIDIDFQGQTNTSTSKGTDQIINILVDPSYINNQLISVTAVYDIDSTTEFHTDTIRVNIITNDQLIGFKVNQKVVELRESIPYYPNYSAIYNTSIAGVYNNDPAISVNIADPTVVQYNQPVSSFIAISDTGSTYAVIEYNGFKDTLYFVNVPNIYSGCINKTLANGNLNNSLIWEKGTVPSTCDSVVIMPGHTLTIDTSVQIRAINILPGGTVILSDSTVILQVGGEDDGGNSFVNNGSLTINKGTLRINGSIKHNTNSSFEMTGGKIIIDGNTSFESTSANNGSYLFDVSNSMNSFSFTGGTLQFIDPPLGENSQAINCSYNFGDSSILKFGDGISTTASNNLNGFGGTLMPAKIGRLIIDAATSENNRVFNNINPLIIKKRCDVLSGHLIQTGAITVEQ